MATRKQNNTGRTIAVIGGGALLVWLLWRGRGNGKGSGLGRGNGKGSGSGGDRTSAPAAVEVRVRSGDRIELDGISSDLPTTVARARTAGTAFVYVSGDARQGWVEQVVDALRAAGVNFGLQG